MADTLYMLFFRKQVLPGNGNTRSKMIFPLVLFCSISKFKINSHTGKDCVSPICVHMTAN